MPTPAEKVATFRARHARAGVLFAPGLVTVDEIATVVRMATLASMRPAWR